MKSLLRIALLGFVYVVVLPAAEPSPSPTLLPLPRHRWGLATDANMQTLPLADTTQADIDEVTLSAMLPAP